LNTVEFLYLSLETVNRALFVISALNPTGLDKNLSLIAYANPSILTDVPSVTFVNNESKDNI
jgi:hypothetical protein